jgi:glycerol-1-phosphate dehydrogenase [NAD(P)+]
VDTCCKSWPQPEELEEQTLKIFSGTLYPTLGVVETKAKYLSREDLCKQLQKLRDNWPDIRSGLLKQLVPFTEVKRRLKLAGAPVEPEDIGVSRRHLHDSFIRAQMIRRRFTVLDLAVRTGYMNKWLDGLFTAGGIWEIKNSKI